ncbi:MAG: PEP-CTERM sorting domain-containing protein, partial [Planctomycetaceae bacterium]|nr:PEP-CTERM sorting domain-containing protein [Planctomycetaceae bacterium]
LLATYFDKNQGIPALQAGNNSATFAVLTNQAPTQKFVSILGTNPIDPASPLTTTFSPQNGSVEPAPVPEPATILAWAGMMGAIALVRRVRKGRLDLA